ncbi:hypothetical protein [Streptomyces sp. NPDC049040]|uniref:hypothetical protein n=1 Tax=Streptomyces sp. NPDC049040 TaxID=3365593 RepID=UPI003716ABFC
MTGLLSRPGNRHAVAVRDWRRERFEELFALADDLERRSPEELRTLAQGTLLGVLFYQNSTRTRLSFETAMRRIGGASVGFADAATTRAGDFFQETLEDTVRIVGGYTDVLVLRHTDDDAAERAALHSPVPVISAGTGEREHPTQAMLDTWMMRRRLGSLDGAHIGLVGDPACRTLRSILYAVAACGASRVTFLAPEGHTLPEDVTGVLRAHHASWQLAESATDMVRQVDAISMIPFELPDFHVSAAAATRDREPLPERYRFTRALLAGSPVQVFHTGPRGDELPAEVDDLANVRYFDGVQHGVTLRAALLADLLDRA